MQGGPFAIIRLQFTSRAVEAPAGQTETDDPPNPRSWPPKPLENLHRHPLMQPGDQSEFSGNMFYFQ
jgi:hypothetical protein